MAIAGLSAYAPQAPAERGSVLKDTSTGISAKPICGRGPAERNTVPSTSTFRLVFLDRQCHSPHPNLPTFPSGRTVHMGPRRDAHRIPVGYGGIFENCGSVIPGRRLLAGKIPLFHSAMRLVIPLPIALCKCAYGAHAAEQGGLVRPKCSAGGGMRAGGRWRLRGRGAVNKLYYSIRRYGYDRMRL